MENNPTAPGTTPEVHAVLASFPRSGRTWLAGMVTAAQNRTIRKIVDGVPARAFVSNLEPDAVSGWQGDYGRLAPPLLRLATHENYDESIHTQNIVLLVRQPLDALYSYYLYRSSHTATFDGKVEDFLKTEGLGVNRLAKWYNSWSPTRETATVITYEELLDDTPRHLARALDGLDMDWDCDVEQIAKQFEFEKRQKIERERRDDDPTSTDELFVRSGKVGDGAANFSKKQQSLIGNRLDKALTDESKQLLTELGYR